MATASTAQFELRKRAMKDISGETAADRKQDLVADLLFLEAWERGFIPWSVGPILNSRT
jgi:hypothetical protein